MTVAEFALLVLSVRARHAFSVVSWFRTPARNAAVGGVPNSLHLVGLAVDIVLDGGEDEGEVQATVERLGLRWVKEPGGGVHIQAP